MRGRGLSAVLVLVLAAVPAAQTPAPVQAPLTAIRAGRLLDPEAGRVLTNQIILIEEPVRDDGPERGDSRGRQVIDLSPLTRAAGPGRFAQSPGAHLQESPRTTSTTSRTCMDSTALRAIQAASNGIQMLSSGFTIVRDLGNNGNYADTALRQAIEQGWIPGPTIINSGIIIGGMGGQFSPTPEMAMDTASSIPSTSTPTRPTRSSRRSGRTCCSARR